jgi:hypothetical protein
MLRFLNLLFLYYTVFRGVCLLYLPSLDTDAFTSSTVLSPVIFFYVKELHYYSNTQLATKRLSAGLHVN